MQIQQEHLSKRTFFILGNFFSILKNEKKNYTIQNLEAQLIGCTKNFIFQKVQWKIWAREGSKKT